MRFRKLPVEIEAVRFDGTYKSFLEIEKLRRGGARKLGKRDNFLMIRTLEGDMKANIGDYIIKGVKGEIYPCKADIFELTYEPSENATILEEKGKLTEEVQSLQQQLEEQASSFNDGYDTAKRHYRDQLIELEEKLDKAGREREKLILTLITLKAYAEGMGYEYVEKESAKVLKQIKGE